VLEVLELACQIERKEMLQGERLIFVTSFAILDLYFWIFFFCYVSVFMNKLFKISSFFEKEIDEILIRFC
jgi:hypothetical protein